MSARPYHHGDLRAAILAAAVEVIAESGPAAVSLRDLARRAGVSHAAPAHHFGDKAGLLTAVAVEGFGLLARELAEERERSGSFVELGVAYVRFAIEHSAYFAVMFRPELYHADDEALLEAGRLAAQELSGGAGSAAEEKGLDDPRLAGVAAWSLVHGFATLWLDGNIDADVAGDDPEAAAREVAKLLFRP